MVALLQRPDVLSLLSGSQAKQAEALRQVEVLKTRLARAAAQNADDLITDDQLRVITAKQRPRLAAAEAAARLHRPSPHLALVMETVGPHARERWESYSILKKRAIMDTFGVRVIVERSRRGRGLIRSR